MRGEREEDEGGDEREEERREDEVEATAVAIEQLCTLVFSLVS